MEETMQLIAEPGAKTIVVTRTFDAPRDLVFEAWTTPEHLARWWGPREQECVRSEVDLRVGGGYVFVSRGPDGQDHPFKGEYLEITPPERLVCTFVYDVEGWRDFAARDTLVLEEREGRTTATINTEHQTVEARDGQLGSGMEGGMRESFERLDELLAGMREGANR